MKSVFLSLFLFFTTTQSRADIARNILIENCSSFPYYGDPNSSSARLAQSVDDGTNRLNSCLSKNSISPHIRSKILELNQILESNLTKTLKCTYGETYSYYAKATLGPEKDQGLTNQPPHPSIVFDTNRISGNFPVEMSLKERVNTSVFYKIPLEEVKPGERNHHHIRINNPTALVAHEMLHWTGIAHKSNELDLIYLSQVCCFEIKGVSTRVQQAACKIIEDKKAWQTDSVKRKQHIAQMKYLETNRMIVRAYHNQ